MKILEPLQIGDITIRNRVVMAPMISNLANPQGYPSEEHIAYLSRRASTAGLIITEYCYVNRTDSRGSPNQLGLYDDELLPKFSRLTDAVHSRSSKIFVQLVHVGRKTRSGLIWGRTPIAPSPIPLLDQVREMTEEDIKRVIKDFGDAAERAEKANFDGIEIHGAHGYLVAQFLSPATNERNDRYSDGTVFLLELLEEVRRRTSLPVGLRISVTEFDDNGLTPDRVSKILEKVSHKLDYIHLSAGRDGPLGASMPFYWKRPAFLEFAKQVRKPSVPLFLVGSVITLREAEAVLEVADAVVLGRQLLADPDWLIKGLRGEPVRPCIRCNQWCRGFSTREVRCDVNPELGWELLPLRPGSGRVTVVGGGLMGLEASRVLALRGFKVTLLEKGVKLGGQLNWIMDPWKREFLSLLEYYERELTRLGVEIQLGVEGKREDGLWMVPDESQPSYEDHRGKRILIDSNLYAYQDYAFSWAQHNEVFITERSLHGLDRTRRYLLEKAYSERGIKVVKERVEVDVVYDKYVRNQPTIGQAVSRGYWAAMEFRG
jgi:NADH:flavin oxidoreductases, Old Yellow Enzyme family